MKKALLLISSLAVFFGTYAQEEKKENNLTYSFGGFINLNAICDFNGLVHYDDFTTSEIPVDPTPYDNTMRFHMTARQSRLNFNMNYHTPIGMVTGKISADFYSGNQGDYSYFRLREAYIQYENLLLGQTNTTFGNPDVVPTTIDFEGPNSAPTLRNPMISYTNTINKKWSYGLALEMRGSDITSLDSSNIPFSTVPSLVANINKEGHWGVITFSATMNLQRYFNSHDHSKASLGYGGALSAIFNTTKKDHISLFAVAGQGVANFISDLSGNGYNGILEPNPDKLKLLNSYGGFIGYTHSWSPKWSSNLIYSFVELQKTSELSNQAFYLSHYALGNIFYQPLDQLMFGIEYIWGNLYEQNDERGDANRLQFLAQFNF